MPFYKIVIDCNLAGCREEYFVEADTEKDAEDHAEELAQQTFEPYGMVEKEMTAEEVEEEGLPEG